MAGSEASGLADVVRTGAARWICRGGRAWTERAAAGAATATSNAEHDTRMMTMTENAPLCCPTS